MSAPRIPEMFFRALKRKESGGGTTAKRLATSEDKENLSIESKNMDTVAPEQKVLAEKPVEVAQKEKADGEFLMDRLFPDGEWKESVQGEFGKPYVKEIERFLTQEYTKGVQIFPPRHEIFSAFQLTPLDKVKVVIIGQDPYHGDGQAHGLSFSVKRGIPIPGSLRNIYKELSTDIPGFVAPKHGFLEEWARQGVLMLNAALTVKAHEANSHSKIGWYKFTDHVIDTISKNKEHVVFVLWGGFAHKKDGLIDKSKHVVIKEAHPSPLSARFFLGCKCFSKVNEHLEKLSLEPIDWKRVCH